MNLKGKKGLIVGLANNKSIAYGIAQSCKEAGAELGFTYLNEALKKRVEPIAKDFNSKCIIPLDVGNEDDMKKLRQRAEETMGKIDFLIHSIAFAPKEALAGSFVDTSKEAFDITMNISVFSLLSISKELLPIFNEGASILTLSYFGAEKYVPNYNIMGVAKAALETSVKYLAADLGPKGFRVNAISAGPIKTLAASGIDDFRYILKWNETNSPLRKNTSIKEVGDTASFLVSPLAKGITAEIVHVDGGYNIMGMAAVSKNEEGKIDLLYNQLEEK